MFPAEINLDAWEIDLNTIEADPPVLPDEHGT
jgi:hypothetical protein